MSEELLIQHCSPTLAGIKTGSLFSCPYKTKAQIVSAISRFNQKLVPKGLRIIPLRYSGERVLIYVYRPSYLAADLGCCEVRTLLEEAGYSSETVDRCVLELAHRIQMEDCFPHEIGLFLGYPPEDVQGFIQNKACGYKCVGCWKVYGDAEKAKKTFERYKRCTESYCAQWSKGIAIERLTVAV